MFGIHSAEYVVVLPSHGLCEQRAACEQRFVENTHRMCETEVVQFGLDYVRNVRESGANIVTMPVAAIGTDNVLASIPVCLVTALPRGVLTT